MCFKLIKAWWNNTPLSLPYPEEAKDDTRTMENTDIANVVNDWFFNYAVPEEYKEFWLTSVNIHLSLLHPYPSCTYGNEVMVRPEWASAGIIAHEACHVVYAPYLTADQKLGFQEKYNQLILTDPLMKLLASKKSLVNPVEAHAEIYRYLGEKMPEVLKVYYPKLL